LARLHPFIVFAKNVVMFSPTNIVNLMRTQTCSGCHHYSGNPGDSPAADLGGGAVDRAAGDSTHPKMDFTQESERDDDLQPAIVGSGKRYAISNAVDAFLMFREAFMKKALGPALTSTRSAWSRAPSL
jgi:hypothetical protein